MPEKKEPTDDTSVDVYSQLVNSQHVNKLYNNYQLDALTIIYS